MASLRWTCCVEGDRYTAYLTYESAISKLEKGNYEAATEVREANNLVAVLMGNMAVVCSGISHGTVFQV